MTDDKHHTLQHIYDRMCFHSGASLTAAAEKRAHFIASLLGYPEDLICAAYLHLQHYIAPNRFPSEEDFILFMQPEYMRRQACEQFSACMELEA